MLLTTRLGILSLTYFSHAGCQQAAEQAHLAMYHPEHLSLGHSFQEALKLMLAHIYLFL